MDEIAQVIEQGKFQPTWESLQQFSVPAWYEDAKFGIFIHWGVFSVPAFKNEWYSRNMYVQGSDEFEHHVATYGAHTEFGYKDFIPQFKAENFDPDHWADLFQKAGARYVVPVAEHHDGFALYDSAHSRWTAAKMGPKRDLLGDLAAAVRAKGLVFGFSNHRAEHWWFMNGGMAFPSDVQDPAYRDFYGPAMPGASQDDKEAWHSLHWEPAPDAAYLEDWFLRLCELVDKYQPQLIYFDWWIEQAIFAPWLQKFAAYYYNRGEEWGVGVAINYKHTPFPAGTAVFDVERGLLAGINPRFWQTDTSVGNHSWGYVEGHEYKSVDHIVDDLVDIVSKNGTLLLNIGPRPDGTIPEAEEQILLGIGEWLAINGEAIYGSRPWKTFGEGPAKPQAGEFTDTERPAYTGADIRFTTQGDTLYAIALAWPGEQCVIRALGTQAGLWAGEIAQVELLGHAEPLTWTRDEDSLTVSMPPQQPCEHAFTLKISGA